MYNIAQDIFLSSRHQLSRITTLKKQFLLYPFVTSHRADFQNGLEQAIDVKDAQWQGEFCMISVVSTVLYLGLYEKNESEDAAANRSPRPKSESTVLSVSLPPSEEK